MADKAAVRRGTLTLMIPKTSETMSPPHGHGVARRWERTAAIPARFLTPAEES